MVTCALKRAAKDMKLLPLATDLVAFFVLGFQLHANYFIDNWFKPLQVFISTQILQENRVGDASGCVDQASIPPDEIPESPEYSIRQTPASNEEVLEFIVMVKAAMAVHSGYPELYIPLMEKLDQACGEFLVGGGEAERVEQMIEQYRWRLDDTEQGDIGSKEVETVVDQDAKSDKSAGGEVVKVAKQFKYKGLGRLHGCV